MQAKVFLHLFTIKLYVLLDKEIIILYNFSKVFNQVLQNPGTIWGSYKFTELYSQPVKRRCTSINSPVDMIDRDKLEEAWPMIQILTVLFAKYPKRMQSDDFISLLKILDTYLTQSSKHVKVIDSLYDLCTVLMEIEQLFLNIPEKVQHTTNVHWYNIWDNLLRCLIIVLD